MIIETKKDIFSLECPRIIAHVCNNAGKFGAGFAQQIAKIYPEAKEDYEINIKAHKKLNKDSLGVNIYTKINFNFLIVSMISMKGVRSKTNIMPLRYGALEKCLNSLKDFNMFYDNKYEIHMPKIGSGFAGGDWEIIKNIIDSVFGEKYVYVHVI